MDYGIKSFDTSAYEDLPVTVVVYEIVRWETDGIDDYRIVYGNRNFARDYRMIYGKEAFLGALAVRDHLIDDYTLQRMNSFRDKPESFCTYVPQAGLYVHMQPLTAVPDGYVGYLITNMPLFRGRYGMRIRWKPPTPSSGAGSQWREPRFYGSAGSWGPRS